MRAIILGLPWSTAISTQSYFNAIGRAGLVYFPLAIPYITITIALVTVSRQVGGPRWLGKPYLGGAEGFPCKGVYKNLP